jgi:hypothetical protein
MLTPRYNAIDDDADSIHNFYERRVLEAIHERSERARTDRNFLADVACVALNRLPPKYIRYDVDMTFFISPQEMIEIEEKIHKAVDFAIQYVADRQNTTNDK